MFVYLALCKYEASLQEAIGKNKILYRDIGKVFE